MTAWLDRRPTTEDPCCLSYRDVAQGIEVVVEAATGGAYTVKLEARPTRCGPFDGLYKSARAGSLPEARAVGKALVTTGETYVVAMCAARQGTR